MASLGMRAARTKIEFAPGVILDDTDYQAEGGYTAAQWVRWRQGKPEVKGGFLRLLASTFAGVCRGAWTWADLSGKKNILAGCGNDLVVVRGSPLALTTHSSFYASRSIIVDANNVPVATPFVTASGSPVITVSHPNHKLKVGDIVYYNPVVVQNNVSISGPHTITAVVDPNIYQFNATTNANASGAIGAAVTRFEPRVSTANYSSPLIWSIDNFGEDGFALPSGGALLSFQPADSYTNIAPAPALWGLGTGWSLAGSTFTGVAGVETNINADIAEATAAGRRYLLSLLINTTTSGTVRVKVDNTQVSSEFTQGSGGSISPAFYFTMPPNGMSLIIQKDASWAGTVIVLSLALDQDFSAVENAPKRSNAMFVTPEASIALLGTIGIDDRFDPMLVRTSGFRDPSDWTPGAESSSSFYRLSSGSRIVGGITTRQESLIFTDTSIYGMRATGSNTDPYDYPLIATGVGLIGPHAAVEVGGQVFFMSNSGELYTYNGGAVSSIDCRLRRDVFDNLAPANFSKVVAFANVAKGEVGFLYPDTRDATGECSRELVFCYTENFWYCDKISRSFWVDRGVFDTPLSFDFNGRIQQEETGSSADGAALVASLTTGAFDIGDGDTFARVQRFIADFKGQTSNIRLRIYGRNNPNASWVELADRTVTPTTQMVDFRAMARQLKFDFYSSSTTNYWRAGQWAAEVAQTGVKR